MSSTVEKLNDILSEELDNFFDKNEGELRPWQTAEWKENRNEIFGDECEWSGETDEAMHIHHTDSGPNWSREWIKATDIAFVNSNDWNAELAKNREECPNCNLRDYYARKTKNPKYRCNNCGETFKSPKTISPKNVISNDKYDTKPYVKSGYYKSKLDWLSENRSEVRTVFAERFQMIMDEYMNMVEVVTICQSCHFQEEQTSNKRCKECGENWHKYNKEMCWDCLVEIKGLVKCDCGDGWYQESKYQSCSSCR